MVTHHYLMIWFEHNFTFGTFMKIIFEMHQDKMKRKKYLKDSTY